MASSLYNAYRESFLDGTANVGWNNTGGTLRAYLVLTTYTPSTSHSTLADVTAAKIVGGQYTEAAGKGVKAFASPTTPDGDGTADGEDLVFAAVTAGDTFDKVVIAKCAGAGAGTDPIIGWWEVNSTLTNGADITVQWAAASPKIFKL